MQNYNGNALRSTHPSYAPWPHSQMKFHIVVAQVVYGGDPGGAVGSAPYRRYEAGVRLGSLGMALYSASCSLYSLRIEKLVSIFGVFTRCSIGCSRLG